LSAAGRHIVVTGASTGIGRATALHLDELGFSVHAGVRKPADAERLAADASERFSVVIVDVTDSASIATAVAAVERAAGGSGLAGLVNNAGIAVPGPLEFLPIEDFRRQIEVNLTGHVAVTQAFLPQLRTAKGRIVNVTSIGGLIAFPFMGAYHASKFALEAVTDALRRELRPWGIHVAAIEPGSVATDIWERGQKQADEIRESMPAEGERLYGVALDDYQTVLDKTAERGIEPRKVAQAIEHALTSRRPKTRYLVGTDASIQARIEKLLPDRVFDAIVARSIGG